MRIPAYCPTCQRYYPSPIDIPEGSQGQFVFQDNITNCPYGHMANILDFTYSLRDGLRFLQANEPARFARIGELATSAVSGEKQPQAALDEILEISPEISAALKGKVGPIKILAIICIILMLIRNMTGSLADIAEDARTILYGTEKSETQSTHGPATIVNNVTVINKIAARSERKQSAATTLTPEQIRKHKIAAKKKQKKARKKARNKTAN